MTMKTEQTMTLVLEIGELQVFQTSDTTPLYYWRFVGNALGYGPFPSIYDAGSHYARIIKTNSQLALTNPPVEPTVIKDNVIYVDFKAKKRVHY